MIGNRVRFRYYHGPDGNEFMVEKEGTIVNEKSYNWEDQDILYFYDIMEDDGHVVIGIFEEDMIVIDEAGKTPVNILNYIDYIKNLAVNG